MEACAVVEPRLPTDPPMWLNLYSMAQIEGLSNQASKLVLALVEEGVQS